MGASNHQVYERSSSLNVSDLFGFGFVRTTFQDSMWNEFTPISTTALESPTYQIDSPTIFRIPPSYGIAEALHHLQLHGMKQLVLHSRTAN
ncbi:hypothetical protein HBH98_200860 [Parastagonospora nodorum]|nr:hypothetical protein HBH54_194900 [Parastagonospora nodorum]KAH3940172.1 hypothetical protein HBH53_222490 [Parastagonospora nodorum]KAH4012302.1 hypothetical protein HBI13_191490 [Parastagonospora nodorum]KAH4061873.1 hypothetical protein HBH50_216580 [Parastagonospora nodorum]KAH4130637.1 hypothetical protein HBH45_198840 [Parastagonospora nodorum]